MDHDSVQLVDVLYMLVKVSTNAIPFFIQHFWNILACSLPTYTLPISKKPDSQVSYYVKKKVLLMTYVTVVYKKYLAKKLQAQILVKEP